MSDFTGVISRQRTQSNCRLMFLLTFSLWWALLVFFGAFPAVDLDTARLFFTPGQCHVFDAGSRTCGVFAYDKSPLFSALRSVLFALPYLAIVVVLASIIHSKAKDGVSWRSRHIEISFAALFSLALGCGVIVNLLLKTFSGRPRPRETSLFGGSLDFVQAGSFAGKCVKNCSFVSGEASSAGWLFCLIILVPSRWRLRVGVPLALVSFAVPVLRVMTGAHYLSDAVLGWLSSIVVFIGVLAVIETVSQRRYFNGDG